MGDRATQQKPGCTSVGETLVHRSIPSFPVSRPSSRSKSPSDYWKSSRGNVASWSHLKISTSNIATPPTSTHLLCTHTWAADTPYLSPCCNRSNKYLHDPSSCPAHPDPAGSTFSSPTSRLLPLSPPTAVGLAVATEKVSLLESHCQTGQCKTPIAPSPLSPCHSPSGRHPAIVCV